MTKIERQKFNELIFEIGSLVELINPGTQVGQHHSKKLYDVTIEDMISQIGFLRVYTKYNLFDIEACRRELIYLLDVIKNPGGQEIG